MPSPPAPKRWKALETFTYRGRRYQPGDPVDDPRTIARLHESRLIAPTRKKPEPQPEPEEIPDGS